MTLCMAAAAFLARLQASLRRAAFGKTEQNESAARRVTAIRLGLPSVPEIRSLIARLLLRSPFGAAFILEWSAWRQRHQFGAAEAHYRAHKAQL